METLKEVESILILKSLRVNEISFERDTSINDNIDMSNSRMRFGRMIEEFDNGDSLVTLNIHIQHKTNETKIFLELSGLFGFSSKVDDEFRNQMLERNAVSIIFPYLRSQLSIVSTQPGMIPIVLPAINIISLLENED